VNKQPGQIDPIKEINIKLRLSNNQGLFHDSRADARTCMEALNICIDKINEIVKAINEIKIADDAGKLTADAHVGSYEKQK
jgi:hypothetical protein